MEACGGGVMEACVEEDGQGGGGKMTGEEDTQTHTPTHSHGGGGRGCFWPVANSCRQIMMVNSDVKFSHLTLSTSLFILVLLFFVTALYFHQKWYGNGVNVGKAEIHELWLRFFDLMRMVWL